MANQSHLRKSAHVCSKTPAAKIMVWGGGGNNRKSVTVFGGACQICPIGFKSPGGATRSCNLGAASTSDDDSPGDVRRRVKAHFWKEQGRKEAMRVAKLSSIIARVELPGTGRPLLGRPRGVWFISITTIDYDNWLSNRTKRAWRCWRNWDSGLGGDILTCCNCQCPGDVFI